ncbi:MAG: penicillin acylase family protein [bacterium]|nr:penicillin acylase family protein [bacterium]
MIDLPFRRPAKNSRRLILSGLLLLGLAAAAGAQPIQVSGLSTDALVVYDSDGVPHIFSDSDHDTFLLLGYIHAQDRFFQMDSLRRTFSGTLAELVGASALPSDVQFRTFGLRRAAEESLTGYKEAGLDETLAMLDAYAAGVNHYLRTNPLPPEYAGLELTQAEPWTPLDSVVVMKGLAFGLSFDLLELDLTVKAGAYSAVGAVAGFDGLALLFDDLERSAPTDPTVSVPQAKRAAAETRRAWRAPDARTAELAKRYLDLAAEIPMLKSALSPREAGTGSNWWVLAGEHTDSGYPMLANDPHLSLDTPTTFYEAHFLPSAGGGKAAAGALNAYGVTFPGLPGLPHGCNTEICWGSTYNALDVTDVYQEVLVIDPATGVPTHTLWEDQQEPLVLIPQTYLVNQVGDGELDNPVDSGIGPLAGGLTFIVPRRNNGPILAVDASQLPVTGLSIQYSGWRSTLELEAFRRWMRTDNIDDFVAGLQYFDVGSQNWVYADVHGDIGYFTSAELPIREDLQNLGFPDGGVPPFMIRDGTHTLRHEWLALQNPQPQQSLGYEVLPFAEMPQVRNPAAGYVINANNDPIGNTLDNNVLNELRPGGGVFYLAPGYSDLRVGRIARMMDALLAGGGKAGADDLKAMQANNQLLDAELLAPFLVDAFANASAAGAPAALQELAADAGVAEAIGRLAAWDYSTPTGIAEGYDPGDDPNNLPAPSADEIASSVAATVYSAWRGQMVRSVIDGTLTNLGLGDYLPGSVSAHRALLHHLMSFDANQGIGASGVDFFVAGEGALSPEQERDLILLDNLRAALDLLAGDEFGPAFHNSTDQDDYRWGYLHRIVFDHLLGDPFNVPAAGGFDHVAADLRGVARAGGFEAVDASSHSARADGVNDFMFGAGPVRRFVGVLDPAGIEADQILPGGQSGVVVSPHYASQLGRWLTNNYHPVRLLAGDVMADAVVQQPFDPACRASATTLCLRSHRFKVDLTWNIPAFGDNPAGVVPGASNASGNFYFFDPENWEMLVKVLDGCPINGHYWFFLAAATDVGWRLTIEDTASGQTWTDANPFGRLAGPVADTAAFSTCP